MFPGVGPGQLHGGGGALERRASEGGGVVARRHGDRAVQRPCTRRREPRKPIRR
jgi:hypothetical protein